MVLQHRNRSPMEAMEPPTMGLFKLDKAMADLFWYWLSSGFEQEVGLNELQRSLPSNIPMILWEIHLFKSVSCKNCQLTPYCCPTNQQKKNNRNYWSDLVSCFLLLFILCWSNLPHSRQGREERVTCMSWV